MKRPKSPVLKVELLEDRTTPSGSQIPAGEFNWTQFSPTGNLGQLIWNGQSLVYRTRAGGAWQSEVVAFSDDYTRPVYNSRDEMQTASQTAQLVYSSNGTPNAFFLEKSFHWQDNTFQTYIRHYARTANGWRMVETITPTWRTTWGPNNLVVEAGPDNSFHLIFTETLKAATAVGQFGVGRLNYATNASGHWTFAKIADTADLNYDVWILGTRYAPRFLSLAVDAQGNAHVTYTPEFFISGAFGTVTSDLMYATNASGSWQSQTIVAAQDGSADAGLGASIAVAPNGQIAVASYYVDRYITGSPEHSWLNYSTRNADGTWTTVTAVNAPDGYVAADGPRFTGFAPQLSFDAQSHPTILFSDEASEHLPVSYANEMAGQIRSTTLVSGSWSTTTIYKQTDPLVNQLFYPVVTRFNGQTVYAGVVATSTLDSDKNPLRVDFSLLDINAPSGSPPVVSPPPPPGPPLPPPPPPPPPALVHPVLVSGTEAGVMTIVRANYSDGSAYLWTPFGSYYYGGASVALGDVNHDGVNDIIVASGAGIPGMVRVWDGATRAVLGTYTPLGAFAGGLTVAAGDVNGDGYADIVVGVAGSGSPVVTVISGATRKVINQFPAYGWQYLGGLALSVGDINHDGHADIVVGPASSAKKIRIFDGSTISSGHAPSRLVTPFYPFAPQAAPGMTLAVGDVTGDGFADIVVGNATGAARFRIYSGADLVNGGTATPLVSQAAWKYDGLGVRVALVEDMDGDTRPDLVLTKRGSTRALRLYSSQSTPTGWPLEAYSWFQPMGGGINSGVYVG